MKGVKKMRGNCRKTDDDCYCPIHRGCFPIIIGPTGPTHTLKSESIKKML